MNIVEIIIYEALVFILILVFIFVRTNALVELQAWFERKPVIWMFPENRPPKKVVPWKIEKKGVIFKNKRKHTADYYLLPRCSVYRAGPSQEAILFEGVSFPVDLRYISLAEKAKKMGFPDYTQFEVACCLAHLEKDNPEVFKDYGGRITNEFLYKPQTLEQDEDGEPKNYRQGMDWVKEQIVSITGDPWTFAATDIEIKRSLENKNYSAGDKAFTLLEDFRSWINRNASSADLEDIISSVRIQAKEDAEFGKGWNPLGGISTGTAMAVVLVLIGLSIAYVIFNSGGGIGGLFPSAPNIMPSGTQPPINI